MNFTLGEQWEAKGGGEYGELGEGEDQPEDQGEEQRDDVSTGASSAATPR